MCAEASRIKDIYIQKSNCCHGYFVDTCSRYSVFH